MGKRTAQDPTGQRTNRNRTSKRLADRLNRAMRRSIAEFRSIPRVRKQEKIITNESLTFYLYDLSASDLETLRISIQNYIAEELGTEPQTLPSDWWYNEEIELPIRQGTLEELIQINKQLTSAEIAGTVSPSGLPVQPIQPTRVLFSPRYLDTIREAEIFNYGLIKTMGDSTAQQVVNVIKQGTDAGQTPTQIVDDIVKRFDVSKSNAKRIADTEINRAYNDAKIQAAELAKEESGLDVAVFHLSSLIATTRPNHAARHNKIYTPKQQERWWDSGSNRINCFVPETNVSGRFVAGIKSFYSGKVVKLVTRDGRSITVTPNHKIMTDRGLVCAAEITESDNLIAYINKVEGSGRVTNLNSQQANTRIENVFSLLSNIRPPSTVGIVSEDFNGDAEFMDKNVDRVLADRVLTIGGNTKDFKLLDCFKLKHSNSPPVGFSSFFKRFKTVFGPSPSVVSFSSVLFPSIARKPAVSNILGIAGGSSFNASLVEPSVNSDSRVAGLIGYLKNALSGFMLLDKFRYIGGGLTSLKKFRITPTSKGDARLPENPSDYGSGIANNFGDIGYSDSVTIKFDNVVSINVLDFSGHVYDLQELSGLMIANGLIASNCLCSVRTVILDKDGEIVDSTLRRRLKDARSEK